MEMINSDKNATLMKHYSQISEYRVVMISVFLILTIIVFLLCERSTAVLCMMHWCARSLAYHIRRADRPGEIDHSEEVASEECITESIL
jgi:hypothetical protein